MTTAHDLASRFGVSVAFVTQALAKSGFNVAGSTAPLPAAQVEQFQREWGAKIAANKPQPAAAQDVVESRPAAPVPEVPAYQRLFRVKHVMRPAYSKSVWAKTESGRVVRALPPEPRRLHAIDLVGTRDGDPWGGTVEPGFIHFYEGTASTGPTAACGMSYMRAVESGEFVPADDPETAGQCPRCASLVREGRGFRDEPGSREPWGCTAYLRVKVGGAVKVKDCRLRDRHDGSHRAQDGSEWDLGVADYVPSTDEVGLQIARAF